MNPSTLIGIAAGVLVLIAAVAFSPTDPSVYVNLPGLAIVLGGTMAATFISYPLREVRRIFALVGQVFRSERVYGQRDVDELVHVSQLWARNDVRKVEAELPKVGNPFLRTGVQLLIDHVPEDHIIELLQWRIARLRAREHAEAQLFRVMAGFAPAFGMLGTLVSLINLLTVLGEGDMALIGQQLAVGVMTTFYGILLANLVFKPVAVKLERRTEQRVIVMNMVLQGISMMCEQRSPALLKETLQSFMIHHEDEIHDGGQARAAAPAAEAAKGAGPKAGASAAVPPRAAAGAGPSRA